MVDSLPPSPRRRKIFNESTATIFASVIGGVCALAAALVPNFMSAKNDPTSPASAAAPTTVAAESLPNLTLGSWTFTDSRDEYGYDWKNSVLKFTSQTVEGAGLRLDGFFEWRENGRFVGREFFTANYQGETRQVFIEGQRVENETETELAVGSFSAVLSADGRSLRGGTWGSSAGHQDGVPGVWEARR